MKKRILNIFVAILIILPAMFMFSSCKNEDDKVIPTELVVEMQNNDYVVSNDKITLDWGTHVDLSADDFLVKVKLNNGTTETISSDKFTYTSTLPTKNGLEDGKTPIGNYTITFKYKILIEKTITVEVVKVKVNTAGLVWTDSSNFEYDGTEKTVSITNLPAYLKVESYSGTKGTNAGEYKATATLGCTDEKHYELAQSQEVTHNWEIKKATTDVSGIKLTQTEFVYNGTEQEVSVDETTLPEFVTASFVSGAKATDAGEYTAVVKFEVNNENYEVPANINLTWKVTKATINVSGVKLTKTEFVYVGTEQEVAVDESTLPEGVTASFASGSKATDVGEYTAIVKFETDKNHEVFPQNMGITWKVTKATVDVSGIKLTQTEFVYNGTEQEVAVDETTLPEFVTASFVSGLKATDAGEYTAVVKFEVKNENYEVPANINLTWKVTKATVDVSGVKLTQTEFVYDGTEQEVAVDETTLPEFVTASFVSGSKATDAGEYTAVVKFEVNNENYEVPANINLTWKVTKATVDVSGVKLTKTEFVYVGTEQEVAVDESTLPEGVTASFVSGSKATDAGEYTAVVKFEVKNENYEVPANINLTWKVTKAIVDVSGVKLTRTELVYNGTEQEVSVDESTLPEGVTASFVSGSKGTDAGEYTAVVKFEVKNENYEVPANINLTWKVTKVTVDVSGVKLTRTELVYNGTEQEVAVDETTLPEGVTASFVSGAKATDAGEYTAVVKFETDKNHEVFPQNMGITWKITKATLIVTATSSGKVVPGNSVDVTYVVSGLLNNDTADVVTGKPVYDFGGYDGTNAVGSEFTLSVSGLSAKNYEISYVSSTFEVIDALFEVEVNGKKEYIDTMPSLDESGTYKLLKDISLEELVFGTSESNNLEIVFDLSGHELTLTTESDKAVYFSSLNNIVTLKNGKIYANDAENAIYVEGVNKLVLSNDLYVYAKTYGVTVINGAELETSAEVYALNNAIYAKEGETRTKVTVLDGTYHVEYDYAVYSENCDILLIDGTFYGEIYSDSTRFIVGGKYYECYNLDDADIHNYCKKYYHAESSYYEQYVCVKPNPVVNSIGLSDTTYIIGVGNLLRLITVDNEFNNYIGDDRYEEYITIAGAENLETPGEHTLTITFDNPDGADDVSQDFVVTSVSIVRFEVDEIYIYGRTDLDWLTVTVILSNGEEFEMRLENCVSYEEINEITNKDESELGAIISFNAQYPLNPTAEQKPYKQTLTMNVEKYDVVKVEFSNPSQYIGNKIDLNLNVKYNDGNTYYYMGSYQYEIVSITDSEGNEIENVDSINTKGTYIFTIKVRKNYYGDEFYTQREAELFIGDDDDVRYFDLYNSDIVVGEKPLIYGRTFGNDNFSGDLFDEVIYDSTKFDYNKAGTYEVEFNFRGCKRTFIITVHNPDEVEDLGFKDVWNINSSTTYIIGITELTLTVRTWGGDEFDVEFDTQNVVGRLFLNKRGNYDFTYKYEGETYYLSLNIVNPDDARSIEFSKTDYELNTTEQITFDVVYYNNTRETVVLTSDMVTYGNYPDITNVGNYYIKIEYENYSTYETISIYNPNDTSIDYVSSNFIYRYIWTYDIADDGNVTITPHLDGMLFEVVKKNKTRELMQVTEDMVTYDEAYLKKLALSEDDYKSFSFTVTYEGREMYANGFLKTKEQLQEKMNSYAYINGKFYYGSKVMLIKENETTGNWYICYRDSWDGCYCVPFTADDILDKEGNKVGLNTTGAYDVNIKGEQFVLIVYNENDIKYSARLYSDDGVIVQNTDKSKVPSELDGKYVDISAYYEYPYYISTYQYAIDSFGYYLTSNDIGDLTDVDLSVVGEVKIPMNYMGQTIKLEVTIIPNVEGQTVKAYKYEGRTYYFYDTYVKKNNDNNWYKYEIIDAELGIIAISYDHYTELCIVDDTTMTMKEMVAGEIFKDITPKEFYFNNGYEIVQLKAYSYGDKVYIDFYYQNDKGEYYLGDAGFGKYWIENDTEYLEISGQKFKVTEVKMGNETVNMLEIEVEGDRIYYFEGTLYDDEIKFDFRTLSNGENLAYYFEKINPNDPNADYTLLGTFTWELNGTQIDCYYMGQFAVSFIVEDGEIVGFVD